MVFAATDVSEMQYSVCIGVLINISKGNQWQQGSDQSKNCSNNCSHLTPPRKINLSAQFYLTL
jgi:hypothetical protein